MTVHINDEEKRIGLALSGDGFRATAFHLGVFRRMSILLRVSTKKIKDSHYLNRSLRDHLNELGEI